MHVLDSAVPVPGAAMYAAGYAGVIRYIGDPGSPRCATRQELADVTAYGLGVALVHAPDGRDDDWRGGYPTGHANATIARSHASSVGYPAARPLYFAIGHPAGAHEFARARDYLAGAADALGVGCVGACGNRDVVTMARGAGVASFYWQHRGGQGGSLDIHLAQLADVVDIGGVSCGVNLVGSPDWGQHASAGGAPPMVEALIAAAEHLSDSAVRYLATVYASELARRRATR